MNGCQRKTWSGSNGWRSPSCRLTLRWSSTTNSVVPTRSCRLRHQLRRPSRSQRDSCPFDNARLPVFSTTYSPSRRRLKLGTSAAPPTCQWSTRRMTAPSVKSAAPRKGSSEEDRVETPFGLADGRTLSVVSGYDWRRLMMYQESELLQKDKLRSQL